MVKTEEKTTSTTTSTTTIRPVPSITYDAPDTPSQGYGSRPEAYGAPGHSGGDGDATSFFLQPQRRPSVVLGHLAGSQPAGLNLRPVQDDASGLPVAGHYIQSGNPLALLLPDFILDSLSQQQQQQQQQQWRQLEAGSLDSVTVGGLRSSASAGIQLARPKITSRSGEFHPVPSLYGCLSFFLLDHFCRNC